MNSSLWSFLYNDDDKYGLSIKRCSGILVKEIAASKVDHVPKAINPYTVAKLKGDKTIWHSECHQDQLTFK